MTRRTIDLLTVSAILHIATFGSFLMAEDKIQHTKDSLETIQKLLAEKKAVIVDVREKDEWDEGHLKKAKFLPLSDLDEIKSADELKSFDKKSIIYCHCKLGGRALRAAEILKRFGYDCRPIKQGYSDLAKSGFETTKESLK